MVLTPKDTLTDNSNTQLRNQWASPSADMLIQPTIPIQVPSTGLQSNGYGQIIRFGFTIFTEGAPKQNGWARTGTNIFTGEKNGIGCSCGKK